MSTEQFEAKLAVAIYAEMIEDRGGRHDGLAWGTAVAEQTRESTAN
jgi:hypothetical protein